MRPKNGPSLSFPYAGSCTVDSGVVEILRGHGCTTNRGRVLFERKIRDSNQGAYQESPRFGMKGVCASASVECNLR